MMSMVVGMAGSCHSASAMYSPWKAHTSAMAALSRPCSCAPTGSMVRVSVSVETSRSGNAHGGQDGGLATARPPVQPMEGAHERRG